MEMGQFGPNLSAEIMTGLWKHRHNTSVPKKWSSIRPNTLHYVEQERLLKTSKNNFLSKSMLVGQLVLVMKSFE